MSENSFEYLREVAIGGKDYPNLCSCSLCWNHKDTKNCKKCNKKFCKNHKLNHFCSGNLGSWV